MTDINSTLDSEMPEGGSKKRSTFVTVICILSFVAIGYNLISGVFGALLHDEAELERAQEELADASDELQGLGFEGIMESFMDTITNLGEHAVTLNWILVVGNIICLLGVLMMWKMKKAGYLPYLIGHLAHVGAGAVLIAPWYLIMLVWLIIFPILYAVNLKDMD